MTALIFNDIVAFTKLPATAVELLIFAPARNTRLLMKKFFAVLFRLLYILLIIIYLSACLTPYLLPAKFWMVSLAGLVFPILGTLLLLFCAGWLFVNWRWCIPALIAMLISYQQLGVMAGYRLPVSFEEKRKPGSLRIMSWNVSSWGDASKYPAPPGDNGALTVDLIKAQHADILCFQEYKNKDDEYSRELNVEGFRKMGYPYAYFAESFMGFEFKKVGVVIFSKFPFESTAKFSYGELDYAEHLIYTDVKVNGQIIRIFTTHLQSVRFRDHEYIAISKVKNRDGRGLTDSKVIASKLRFAYQFREEQAKLAAKKIAESPYPVIFCGDFNDVPNSFTYFTISDGLQDAFLQKGSGIGRTFRYLSPTLRIDYILASKQFGVSQYNCLHVPYSDHYPVVADFDLAK